MEEFLDIVNENDVVIGKENREEVFKKGLEHSVRCVNIFVFNKRGQLLLPKRSMNRRIFPGCYDFSCGGYNLSGEDYYNAAIRELKEELGIKNPKLIELGKLTPKDGVSCFMKIYKVIWNKKIKNWDRDIFESLAWYDLDRVKQMVKENKKKFKEDFPIVFKWYLKKTKK